ncbi:MAG TPA: hypothetical protein VGI29_12640 [Candidatus Binataceae bacterium]
MLVQGGNVLSYVPKGAWDGSTSGVSVIQVEGAGVASAVIPTASVINSCSSNSTTGETVCTANSSAVYLINGTSVTSTLHSSGTGKISFSGGSCTNCGVVINATTNQALITLSTAKGAGFQFLDLGDNTFEPDFPSQSSPQEVSEDAAIDPVRHLLLSATEASTYEVGDITDTTTPKLFENDTSGGAFKGEYDSSAEDCTTGVALATDEFTGNLYLADLSQATFTAGSPATWTAPQQLQNFPEFDSFSAGTDGVSVAGDTHIAVVNGEFGGNLFGAVVLPSSSGTGGKVPAVSDYVACTIPSTPDKLTFETGDDPHTTTAYASPNSGDAIALVANSNPPTWVAVIDMTKLLNTSIVPRIKNGFATRHTCNPAVDLVAAGVVKFVAVP